MNKDRFMISASVGWLRTSRLAERSERRRRTRGLVFSERVTAAHIRQYVRLTGSAYVPLWAGYFDVPYVESGFGLGVTKVVVY